MTTSNAVRISFRRDIGWEPISIRNAYHVAYKKPWVVVVHESEDIPGEEAVTRFHEDAISNYTESPIEVDVQEKP